MSGSRTIKVLVALVAAMTVGAFALHIMDVKPSPIPWEDLIAREGSDYQTDVQVRAWKQIFIHSTGTEKPDIVDRVHFIIEADGAGKMVVPTRLWKTQGIGRHVGVTRNKDYNTDSIGICVRGTFTNSAPSQAQMQALVKLVRTLQQMCDISRDKVLLYRPDLVGGQYSLGKAFPQREFSLSLMR